MFISLDWVFVFCFLNDTLQELVFTFALSIRDAYTKRNSLVVLPGQIPRVYLVAPVLQP